MRTLIKIAAVLAGLSAAVSASAQDAAHGAKVFAQCAVCHSVAKPAKNGVGPSLLGVVGRKAGTVAGFSYSDAVKKSGLTWDEANLDAWLTKPTAKIPGSRMPYAGLANPKDRADVIAYLAAQK